MTQYEKAKEMAAVAYNQVMTAMMPAPEEWASDLNAPIANEDWLDIVYGQYEVIHEGSVYFDRPHWAQHVAQMRTVQVSSGNRYVLKGRDLVYSRGAPA